MAAKAVITWQKALSLMGQFAYWWTKKHSVVMTSKVDGKWFKFTYSQGRWEMWPDTEVFGLAKEEKNGV